MGPLFNLGLSLGTEKDLILAVLAVNPPLTLESDEENALCRSESTVNKFPDTFPLPPVVDVETFLSRLGPSLVKIPSYVDVSDDFSTLDSNHFFGGGVELEGAGGLQSASGWCGGAGALS